MVSVNAAARSVISQIQVTNGTHQGARRECDLQAGRAYGFGQGVIVADPGVPVVRDAEPEEELAADCHGAAPCERAVAGAERTENGRVPDAAHERPKVGRGGEID